MLEAIGRRAIERARIGGALLFGPGFAAALVAVARLLIAITRLIVLTRSLLAIARACILPALGTAVLTTLVRALPLVLALALALVLALTLVLPLPFILALALLAIIRAGVVGPVVAALVEAAAGLTVAVLVVIIRAVVAIAALFLEPLPSLAEDPEIMISELKVIFGHDPIALHLGIAGKRLVFFVKLVGIAPRTIIEAIAAVGAVVGAIGRPWATTTATAAVLSIIDQLFAAFVTGGRSPHPIRASPGHLVRAPKG